MRHRLGRPLIIALFAVAPAMLLAMTPMISVPVSWADSPDETLNALMMGGTFQPTPTQQWMDSIIHDYLDPATGASYTGVEVTTPETVPLAPSLQGGLADLQAAMAQQQATDPGAPYLIEGYSQSALIAVDEEVQLAATAATGQPIPDVTVALLGSGNRPNGGIFERFDGFYLPGAEVNADGAEPTDTGIPTIDIAAQYDGFADFPQYPINPLADLNALFGIIYAHGDYGGLLQNLIPGATFTPLPTGPYDYATEYVLGSSEIVKQTTGDTTFYFIPTTELPLLDPLATLGVPESVLNIVQPALQVIIEAGYDRSIPFGDPTPAELIPSIDPVTFTLEFANAVVQGANNAFELFGSQLPGATELESALASAESWSEQAIGVPYDQVVTELNNAFDPFTLFTAIEGPLGQDTQNVLDLTGIQQDLIAPFFGDLVSGIESLEASLLPG
jgi:PE-PPE domain